MSVPPLSSTSSFYAARLHSRFTVACEPPITLQLVEVQAFNGETGFSLTFRGPAAPQLAQMTYVLEQSGSEPIAIFLVPVGCNASGTDYQAVFNN